MPVKFGREWHLSGLHIHEGYPIWEGLLRCSLFQLGDEFPYIVHGFKLRVGVDLSRKESAGYWRERYDTDTVFHTIREYLLFTVALQHGIEILHGGDRRDGVRLGQCLYTYLRQPPCTYDSSR